MSKKYEIRGPGKYAVRGPGINGYHFIKDDGDRTPQEAFNTYLEEKGKAESQVLSFFLVAQDIFGPGPEIVPGIRAPIATRVPGRELIFEVRNLPKISIASQVILATFFLDEKSRTTVLNSENRLTEVARTAFDEMIAADLISEMPSKDGSPEGRTYRLTLEGAGYPREKSREWLMKHAKFPLTERIPAPKREIEDDCPSL